MQIILIFIQILYFLYYLFLYPKFLKIFNFNIYYPDNIIIIIRDYNHSNIKISLNILKIFLNIISYPPYIRNRKICLLYYNKFLWKIQRYGEINF